MSPDPKIQLPDYRRNRRGRDFCRRRKHFWLICRDLCQFCAQLSRFKKRNLPIATISCSCDQITVIPSTFGEILICRGTQITKTQFTACVCTKICHFSWKKRQKMAAFW